MKFKAIGALLTLCLTLSSCGVAYMTNRNQILQTAKEEDYGAPIPDSSESIIKTKMEFVLKDPSSAQYKFPNETGKDAIQKEVLSPEAVAVRTQEFYINGKNSYGGYTGFKHYTAYWKNGSLYAIKDSDGFISYFTK